MPLYTSRVTHPVSILHPNTVPVTRVVSATTPRVAAVLPQRQVPAETVSDTATRATQGFAILDTGCSGHYLANDAPYLSKTPTPHGLPVALPDGTIIRASHSAQLQLHESLPTSAGTAHIFQSFPSGGSLISIGQLCDHGCNAMFTATDVIITNEFGAVVLTGRRSRLNRLWEANITPSTCSVTDETPTPSTCAVTDETITPSTCSVTDETLTPSTCSVTDETITPSTCSVTDETFTPSTCSVTDEILTPSTCSVTDESFTNTNGPHSATHACNAVQPSGSMNERIAFLHAACFSPTLDTWIQAIDAGHFTTWPELTSARVRRFPPSSMAMVQGHLDQSRKNQRSTKPKTTSPSHGIAANVLHIDPMTDEDTLACFTPATTNDPGEPRTQNFSVDSVAITGKLFSDLTGRFVAPSSVGNCYILIVYDYDSNHIFAEPMKNRTSHEHLAAYRRVYTTLKSSGLAPQLQKIDNEASRLLLDFLHSENVEYQLAPPHNHRTNAAERAIRTFKNHFIAGLCSTDPTFPLHLWDRLLPQATLTLNLLRTSRINPRLSAQAQIYGLFDFNKTPLAPPGIRVLVHEKPANRGTWSPHATPGWYIGPAMHHYRCFRIWITETSAERVADTLSWFPTKVLMPTASSTDSVIAAARDLIHALQNPSPASALAPNHHAALQQLISIFTAITANTEDDDIAAAQRVHSNASPPRVPATDTLPRVDRVTPKTVHFSPSVTPPAPSEPIDETYLSLTGNASRRRRQARKKAAERKAVTPPIPIESHHTHGTRSKNRRHATSDQVPLVRIPAALANKVTALIPDEEPLTAVDQTLYANAVIDPNTGRLIPYKTLRNDPEAGNLWIRGMENELGRLAQGYAPNGITGTDTIHFIRHTDVPTGRKATYMSIVAAIKPHKAETHRIRAVVGGNLIDYPGKVSTPTAALTTIKCMLNSIISTKDAKGMTLDISNFYLGTPMSRYEYMKIPVDLIPPSIMKAYNLQKLAHHGYIYVEIRKGMYGLPQAGILANDRLAEHLKNSGYVAAQHTPGLFRHVTRPISFCLVVDDFLVKFIDKINAEHLVTTLKSLYEITTDWNCSQYCGLTLDWDYLNRTVDVSMPGYIERALERFQHKKPTRDQHSPSAWITPTYGAASQLSTPSDDTPPLDSDGILHLQAVAGTLLFYARAVDHTMLVAIGDIASAQAHGTEATMSACVHLLNYAATHPDAVVRYTASDMQLHLHSDASYLSAPNSRSRLGGYFFLSDSLADPTRAPTPDDTPPPFNGPVLVTANIIKVVVASATEAEFAAIFHNCQDAVLCRTILEDLGHPQTATPVQTDNSCAAGIANRTVKQRRSKAMDVRFYWILDRVDQGQFLIHWRKGADNDADYFTKHHSPAHHRRMRSRYLHEDDSTSPGVLRGCIDTPVPAGAHLATIPIVSRSDAPAATTIISSGTSTRRPSESVGIRAVSLATSASTDSHHHQ
jgi:hypothetical protein